MEKVIAQVAIPTYSPNPYAPNVTKRNEYSETKRLSDVSNARLQICHAIDAANHHIDWVKLHISGPSAAHVHVTTMKKGLVLSAAYKASGFRDTSFLEKMNRSVLNAYEVRILKGA